MLFRDKDLPPQPTVDSNETVSLETNLFHYTLAALCCSCVYFLCLNASFISSRHRSD